MRYMQGVQLYNMCIPLYEPIRLETVDTLEQHEVQNISLGSILSYILDIWSWTDPTERQIPDVQSISYIGIPRPNLKIKSVK